MYDDQMYNVQKYTGQTYNVRRYNVQTYDVQIYSDKMYQISLKKTSKWCIFKFLELTQEHISHFFDNIQNGSSFYNIYPRIKCLR